MDSVDTVDTLGYLLGIMYRFGVQFHFRKWTVVDINGEDNQLKQSISSHARHVVMATFTCRTSNLPYRRRFIILAFQRFGSSTKLLKKL